MAGVKIVVGNNGPLRVEGEVEIVDQEGEIFGLGAERPCPCAAAATPSASLSATVPTRKRISRVLRRPTISPLWGPDLSGTSGNWYELL